jgi:hypothetical protein
MTDLKTLREVAERATPGPWRVRTNRHKTTGGEEWGWVSNMTTQNISLPGMSIDWEASTGHANATHIAVFNPVTVLALLDRIEELEGALTTLQGERDRWREALKPFAAYGEALETLRSSSDWDGPTDGPIQRIGLEGRTVDLTAAHFTEARAALHPEPLGEGGGS